MSVRTLLQFPSPPDDHESWFEARYSQLIAWALRITRGDRAQAEDLVHDVFVQFMARRPDLTTIENPDGYLYTSLRHHHLANVRRSARMRETVASEPFDLLAHESLPQGWRAWQVHHAAGAFDPFAEQLCDVWRYTQQRKAAAKSASVLLMRFFHGYYPGEIAQVLKVSRPTVGQLLHLARKEARLFMAAPDAAAPLPPVAARFAPPDLAVALRDAALRSREDKACLTPQEIAALYRGSDDGASVPTTTVAHLVSCAACLDRANRALGLPPLADRHPLDTLGYERDERSERDEPPSRGGPGQGSGAAGGASGANRTTGSSGASGPGGATGTSGRAARQWRRTRRGPGEAGHQLANLLAHRPHELRIAVNGIVLGRQTITAAVSRLTLRIAQQPFDFLEVLSDREVRLLLLSVEPPPRGAVEVHDAITLSDGRRLDVRIDFSSDVPEAHVSYVDHTLFECPVRARVPSLEPSAPARASSSGQRLFAWLRHLARPANAAPADAAQPRRWRLTRGVATSIIAAALGGWLLYHGEAVLSAATMLERSLAAMWSWMVGAKSAPPTERTPDGAVELAPRSAPATTAPAAGKPTSRATTVAPATAGLEIAARAALRRIDADLGEEVRVQRANGRLSLTGIVASAERRAQILSVLAGVRRDPAVRVRIETLDDVHARARSRGTTAAAATPAQDGAGDAGLLAIAPARIALHEEICAALIASGVPPARADDEVARSADRIVRRAQAMRLHAWALRRVLDGVPADEAEGLTGEAGAEWRALIREHARAFLDESSALSVLVRPVLPVPSGTVGSADSASEGPLDARRLHVRGRALVESASRLDSLVQAAFMLPVNGAPSAASSPAAFWLSLHQAAAAAAALERAAGPVSSRP